MFSGSFTDVPRLTVGHAHDASALTGCTVVLFDYGGAVCGVDVRGSAPGTRETDLLNPLNTVDHVHAICLCGGSAYGLDAATGVMRFLEERGIGFDVGVGVVPIVPAAVLFDLAIGDGKVRPDAEMGYRAASAASRDPVAEGNIGAGCGATVGKLLGFGRAMKGGVGSAAIHLPNGLVVGAIVAVNALGEVRDRKTGEVLAGVRGDDGKILDSLTCLMEIGSLQAASAPQPGSGTATGVGARGPVQPGTNTTIAIVASNASLNKTQASKVAQMAHDGLARVIHPVHMMGDGDTVFAAAVGGVDANVDLVGALSAEVLAEAVNRAIRSATSTGGFPAHRDLG